MHQHGRLALGPQAVQHAQRPCDLPCQHRLAELEHVVARHVQHRCLDLLEAQLTRRVQQRELLYFLVCCQQIAFDAVGKERQRALPRLAALHPLALRAQPLRNPLRQRVAFDRVDAQRDPCRIECAEPGTLLLLAVQPRQLHDRHHLVTQRLAVALQCFRAVLARLAGRYADLDELLVSKQAHRMRSAEQRTPVEMGARHGMYLAFAVPCVAGCGTQRVAGFLHQQWLVTPDGVQRPQPFLQVRGELVEAQLHGCSGSR